MAVRADSEKYEIKGRQIFVKMFFQVSLVIVCSFRRPQLTLYPVNIFTWDPYARDQFIIGQPEIALLVVARHTTFI